MSLLVFQHERHEGPGVLGTILQGYGHRLRTIEIHNGHKMPCDLDDVDGLIVMGGNMNVDEVERHPWLNDEMAFIKAAHEARKPIVGICLGAQLIAKALGGEVAAMKKPEVGWQNVKLAFPGTIDPVHAGVAWTTMQFHLHGQEVTKLPPGGTPLSGSAACRTQAFNVGATTYAFQYHFEWDRKAIDAICDDELVKRAEADPAAIRADIKKHYDSYRRIGDRICHNLATLILPIDKR